MTRTELLHDLLNKLEVLETTIAKREDKKDMEKAFLFALSANELIMEAFKIALYTQFDPEPIENKENNNYVIH